MASREDNSGRSALIDHNEKGLRRRVLHGERVVVGRQHVDTELREAITKQKLKSPVLTLEKLCWV